MHGTLVYSNTGISSTDGVVNMGQHTSCLRVWNQNNTTIASIKLNGKYTIAVPPSPANGSHLYHEICGDYTTIEILTGSCTVSVYAIG